MTRVDDALLHRMVKAIVDEVDPEQVILFGSRARGDATADSDVDLVVVEAVPFGDGRDRRAEATRLWRALAFPRTFWSTAATRCGVLARLPQPCPGACATRRRGTL